MLEISNIGIIAAFAAGVVSFLSPCVLPLVPAYVSYVAGHSISGRTSDEIAAVRLQAIALSLCFVLGFSTIFVLLGASASLLGQLLLSYRNELSVAGGAMVIGFGLFMLGLMRPLWLQRDIRYDWSFPGGRPVAAYVLGLAFAFGWTPCIGPILGAILTVSAVSTTVAGGVALLSIYSLGLGVPFVFTAAFMGSLVGRISSIGRVGRVFQALAGLIMVAMGAAMITGQLSTFSYWLLDAFPVLSRIG